MAWAVVLSGCNIASREHLAMSGHILMTILEWTSYEHVSDGGQGCNHTSPCDYIWYKHHYLCHHHHVPGPNFNFDKGENLQSISFSILLFSLRSKLFSPTALLLLLWQVSHMSAPVLVSPSFAGMEGWGSCLLFFLLLDVEA